MAKRERPTRAMIRVLALIVCGAELRYNADAGRYLYPAWVGAQPVVTTLEAMQERGYLTLRGADPARVTEKGVRALEEELGWPVYENEHGWIVAGRQVTKI